MLNGKDDLKPIFKVTEPEADQTLILAAWHDLTEDLESMLYFTMSLFEEGIAGGFSTLGNY